MQELVLSRNILLLGSLGSAEWDDSSGFESFLPQDEEDDWEAWPLCNPEGIGKLRVKYARSFEKPGEEPGLHLGEAISYLKDLKCKMPQDQIYGLLGMVKKSERPEIDYKKSVQQVFLDALAIMINFPTSSPDEFFFENIAHSMKLMDDPRTRIQGRPLYGASLSHFIWLLDELSFRISKDANRQQRLRISSLGFLRFSGRAAVPRWATDRDYKDSIGKWWFECAGKRCFFLKQPGYGLQPVYGLERPQSGVLVGSFQGHVVYYLPVT